MENQTQQIHINAMFESLTTQNKSLAGQLADAHGVIAVLQAKVQELSGTEEPMEGELADKIVD
jgi:hypothetical protein